MSIQPVTRVFGADTKGKYYHLMTDAERERLLRVAALPVGAAARRKARQNNGAVPPRPSSQQLGSAS